ncbi:MAG: butyrate kinase [Lacticaseibacillus paracasei]|nr:butyrate kinase [Lacticaseibacillus paracasei]
MTMHPKRDVVIVINPGSTSSKIALFKAGKMVAERTLNHSLAELSQFDAVIAQKDFRMQAIQEFLADQDFSASEVLAVAGRGGLLKPIPGGTYAVNEAMLDDLTAAKRNEHASNLGAGLAQQVADQYGVKAYVVDPPVVDELQPLARISGLKGIERHSAAHVLNQKAMARQVLATMGKTYATSRVIVAHIGGGLSIHAHENGRMIDGNNGIDGEGPYSPERAGSLPLVDFVAKVLAERLTLDQVKKLLASQSGLRSYLNDISIKNIVARIAEGDETAKFYLDGMIYQIKKQIAEMAGVLNGQVDVIILTGGAAYATAVTVPLQHDLAWIAPVVVRPGEMEMQALYEGVMRVLNHEEPVRVYQSDASTIKGGTGR